MAEFLNAFGAWLGTFLGDAFKDFKDWFYLVYQSVKNFFKSVWDYLGDGVYDLLVWAFKGFVEYATLGYLKFLNFVVPFAWDVAAGILQDLGYVNLIVSAWGALPPDVLGLATVLRLPEGVTILLTAMVSKYVLRFIPGMK